MSETQLKNLKNLLTSFIDAAGYDIEAESFGGGEYEYKVARRKPRNRESNDEYSYHFNVAWKNYPQRVGSNPKNRAYSAYNKRLSEGHEAHDIGLGVINYARFCEATGKTGTEYVMQAATFFGPDLHFKNEWKIPDKPKELLKLPRDNEKLEQFCKDHKLPMANPAEGWGEWRSRLQNHIETNKIYQ